MYLLFLYIVNGVHHYVAIKMMIKTFDLAVIVKSLWSSTCDAK